MKRPNDYLLAAVVMVSDQNSDGKIDHEELLDIMKLYNWVPDDIRYHSASYELQVTIRFSSVNPSLTA